jgi:hypothetical protein
MPATMATLFVGMLGDIAARWLPATPLTVAGIAISGATTWNYLREFLGKLPEVRPYG